MYIVYLNKKTYRYLQEN